jgi:peptidoglycan/xylan/chitin deacetylase (PgdA/CDA1 family)
VSPAAIARRLRDRLRAAAARSRLERQRRPRRLVLAFHNVIPDGVAAETSDRSLHLPRRRFEQLLDAVMALPNVALASHPLDDAGRSARVQVLITFDDAYRGALEHALPALAVRGGAAVVFTAPQLLGCARTWWDRLAPVYLQRGARQWEQRREQLLSLPASGLQDRVFALEGAEAPGAEPPGAEAPGGEAPGGEPPGAEAPGGAGDLLGIATAAELAAACQHGGVWLGCHSFRHACLPSITGAELREELERSRGWLASSGLPWLPWHAFPYGRWSDGVVDALRELEYTQAFRVDAAPLAPRYALLAPRVNVPAGMSPDGLIAAMGRLLAS